MRGYNPFLALPAAGIALLAALFYWRSLSYPVSLAAVPGGRLHCLSYTPFEPGRAGATSPGWVSPQRIDLDVALLSRYTDCLRVYTPLGATPRVVAAARERGLRILLGAWIGSDLAQNDKELRAALELARSYPDTVTALVVGNEVLLRGEMQGEALATLIRETHEVSPVPVAYADVAHFIEESPEVMAAADLLLIHLLPYWDDPRPPRVADAVEQVLRIEAEFRALHPEKKVMIGETGWPSGGRMRGPGHPGLVEQARFVREFALRAGELGVDYNLIEAIDQPWKRASEGTVGGYWGILDENRRPKFPLAGPVYDHPRWREDYAFTAVVILLTVAAALRAKPGVAAWAGWSALAFTLGTALAWQWEFARATSQGAVYWLVAAFFALLTLAAGALLGGRLAGQAAVAPAPLAGLARALAAPRAVLRSAPQRLAAFAALTLLPAAWIGLTLAFDPRHRDVPFARFALPALALALAVRDNGTDDRREEAVLCALLLVCGIAQLEGGNPQSWAWAAVATLLAWPWRRSLGAELARVGRLLASARQAQQRSEHG